MRSEVYCSFSIEGLHRWESCPLEEVSYLRQLHRHMFGVKVYWPVSHSDRDIEFIVAKHDVIKFLKDNWWKSSTQCCMFDNMSCEMIGEHILKAFPTASRVEVNEDGENGAIVYREDV